MHDIDHARPESRRDAGTAVLILWIIVFAGFMMMLMMLGGDGHFLSAHQFAPPAIGVGPA